MFFPLVKQLGGRPVESYLTGRSDVPLSYRELLHWQAYSRIEAQEWEQQMLTRQAKANLPHYHGRV